jgi:hypothetical protein
MSTHISDPYWRAVVEAEALKAGRPANSPGWGMLEATKSGAFTSKGGERTTITAGTSRVSSAHWLAREYPEAFRPCDKRDARTTREHQRSLAHVREELERGRPTSRRPHRRSVLSRGVLPPRGYTPVLPRKAEPWRLPR